MIKSGLFETIKNAKEHKYIQNKDFELIAKMHSRAKLQTEREKLGTVSEADNEELLQDLQLMGFNREMVSLLYLIPLIQIAWSEGTVTSPELRKIIEIARSNETLTKAGLDQLLNWINNKPSDEFFASALNIIGIILESLSDEERNASTKDLLSYCTSVARASDGFFAPGHKLADIKKSQIAEIVAALENPTR